MFVWRKKENNKDGHSSQPWKSTTLKWEVEGGYDGEPLKIIGAKAAGLEGNQTGVQASLKPVKRPCDNQPQVLVLA